MMYYLYTIFFEYSLNRKYIEKYRYFKAQLLNKFYYVLDIINRY